MRLFKWLFPRDSDLAAKPVDDAPALPAFTAEVEAPAPAAEKKPRQPRTTPKRAPAAKKSTAKRSSTPQKKSSGPKRG